MKLLYFHPQNKANTLRYLQWFVTRTKQNCIRHKSNALSALFGIFANNVLDRVFYMLHKKQHIFSLFSIAPDLINVMRRFFYDAKLANSSKSAHAAFCVSSESINYVHVVNRASPPPPSFALHTAHGHKLHFCVTICTCMPPNNKHGPNNQTKTKHISQIFRFNRARYMDLFLVWEF